MFGVDSSELFLIVLVAVVVIGPKDLPRVMRTIGKWVGKARGMASQFRLGIDQMMRETEIAELEKKWREQNEAIMKAHPVALMESDWGKPKPPPGADATSSPVVLDKPDAAAATTATPLATLPASTVPEPIVEAAAAPAKSGRRPPRTAPGKP